MSEALILQESRWSAPQALLMRVPYHPFMTTPAIYKLYKDADDGRTSRTISVSEDLNGKFALIVTDSYRNNSSGNTIDEPPQGRGVGEAELFQDVTTANDRAKEIHAENVFDGFVDDK
jgi:hypothetical protein